MTARLILQDDATVSSSAYAAAFKADLQKYFDEFLGRFDYTTGTTTLHLTYTEATNYALASAPGGFAQAGTAGVYAVLENSPTQGILTGNSTGPMTGYLYVANPYITNVYAPGGPWLADIHRAIIHELFHIFANDYALTNRIDHTHGGQETVFDTNIQFDAAGNAWFNGPNAQSVYGGMIPLDKTLDHPYFGANDPTNINHRSSVMNYNQDQWTDLGTLKTVIMPVDVAMAEDNGLPMLTDHQLGEHFWTRACDVLFHHQVSASAIEAWTRILEANGGDLTGTSTQFLSLLGISSMTGQQLVDAANADDERARLEMAPGPNVSYSHTIEQEITRIYHLATGGQIDPASYAQALHAAMTAPINATTLQTTVAPIFLSSAASAANFSQDVDHQAAVQHILGSAGITNFDAYPEATKAAILTMPIPQLVVALADNATCIQNQAIWASTVFGAPPGMDPAITVNLNHATV